MNWVLVNPYLGPVPGGIENDILGLSGEFARCGDKITIVTTPYEFPGGMADLTTAPAYRRQELSVIRLTGYVRTRLRGFLPANAPLILPGLARAVLSLRPDAVVFFNVGWPLTVLPALPALRRAVPVLYRTAYHAHDYRHRLDPLRDRLQLGVAGLAHRLLPYSSFEKAQIIRYGHVPSEKIVPIYPGVTVLEPESDEVERFRSAHGLDGKLVISHVARLGAFKGTDRLVRVLPEVRCRTGQDVVLLLVGRNLEPDLLGRLVTELGLDDSVRLAGPLSERDLHVAYAASDVFALPSAYESFGLVFLEAMAHGVPVIGVRTGGVPEVIREGETGFILDRCDDENGLADKLVCLVQDRGLRAQFGEAGRQWVGRRFTWAAEAEAVKAVAGRVPAARRAARG